MKPWPLHHLVAEVPQTNPLACISQESHGIRHRKDFDPNHSTSMATGVRPIAINRLLIGITQVRLRSAGGKQTNSGLWKKALIEIRTMDWSLRSLSCEEAVQLALVGSEEGALVIQHVTAADAAGDQELVPLLQRRTT